MMRRPRVAGAEEGSRDPTVLATLGAEENPETTMALPPPETRRTVRGKTEDVAEAEVDSEVAEGSGVEVASEVVAHHFVEVEAEEKAARDNVTTLNITLKTTFG